MKRTGIIIAIIISLLVSISVQAATWAFQFPITITDTSNTTRTNYPVILPNGTSSLSSYISGSGLNTNMQEGTSNRRYMLVTDKITTVVPSLPSAGRVIDSLYTGYSPSQTSYSIITGDGGYITTTDLQNLEGSGNFSLGMVVDIGHSSNITRKSNSIIVTDNSSGSISANVSADTLNISHDVTDTLVPLLGSSGISRFGQTLPKLMAGSITSVSLYLNKVGVPVGTANITLRRVSDDGIIGTFGTQNIALLAVAPSYYTFANPVVNPITQDVRILIEVPDNPVGNSPQIGHAINTLTYGYDSEYIGIYVDLIGGGATIRYSFTPSTNALITTSGIVSGNHTLNINNANALLALYVDSALKDSIYGVSMNNSSSNWLWLEGVPYADNISYSVNNTQQLYYAPNTIISGSTLPDRSADATNNQGAITWGTNNHISLSYGAIISSGSTSISGTNAASVVPDFPMPSRWFGAYQLTPAQADLTFQGAFFYDSIHQQYIDGGLPTLTMYAIIFIAIAFFTLFILAAGTKSILVSVMGAMIVLFAGSQCGTAGAIPMWLPVFGLIVCLALMVSYRQVWY